DKVVIIQGKNDVKRSSPGELVLGAGGEVVVDEPDDGGDFELGSLEDYLADAEEWKARLEQVREWLGKLSGDGAGDDGPPGETFQERLARQVAEKGYANVIAERLVAVAPAFEVHEIIADGVASGSLPGDLIDIRVSNFSTSPALSAKPLRMTMASQSGALNAEFALGGRTAAPSDNVVRFSLTGLSTESIASSLAKGGEAPLSGGTLDLSLDGTWAEQGVGFLDLPLAVTLHGVTVDLPGGAQTVDGVTLTFHISGPIDDPTITFDDDALTDALVEGAKAQLNDEVDRRTEELEGEIDAKKSELQAELDAKKAEAEAELEDELKGKLGGLLGGSLFGGKQNDGDDDGD
ncbi:MAG: hypothetical protein ACI9EF_003775, partial [Pseudohongiellaceae bacterium]